MLLRVICLNYSHESGFGSFVQNFIQSHFDLRIQLEFPFQILCLEMELRVAERDALVVLRCGLIAVILRFLIVFLCCHRKLEVLVNLNVGSKHKAGLVSVDPRGLWFRLNFCHVELYKQLFIKLRHHLWRLNERIAEGH